MKRIILCLLMLVVATVATAHDEHRWPAWLSASQNDGVRSTIPYAYDSVTNTQGAILESTLLTSFGDFGKVDTISQGGYVLAIDYGPDGERWRSVLRQDGVVKRTILYAGDVEQVTEGGTTRTFYYLGHGIIVVKQGDTVTPYVAITDHLGSITRLVNASGTTVFSASYDAWGKQSVGTTTVKLHRGYTGHEMLSEYGLINMNGRLYDPQLGRFLSPDNYVQQPDNSQNFNRYSYCLNNPLKYIDPDGENIIAVLTTVFAIGNTVVHASRGDIHHHGFWNNLREGASYFVQGAITGASIGALYKNAHSVPGIGGFLDKLTTLYMKGQTAIGMLGLLGGAINNGGIKGLVNAVKLFLGNFYIDENNYVKGVVDCISKHTWESIQSLLGAALSNYYNVLGKTDRVDYLGGATFSTMYVNSLKKEKGITLGDYVNVWAYDKISGIFDEYVISHPLYMHEYGHTIDSRDTGPGYLYIGIKSLISAINKESLPVAPFSTHKKYWTERRANRRAKKYFSINYGVNWDDVFIGLHGTKPIEVLYPTY